MGNVESAEQATEIAVDFLKKYYQILQKPLSARLEEGKWIVEVDVGVFHTIAARVVIEADTGKILTYDVPPPPFPPTAPRLRA
jgi:hypothetical protein